MVDLSTFSTTAKIVALARYAGVGSRLFEGLLRRLGSVDNILSAECDTLASLDGMSDESADLVFSARDHLADANVFLRGMKERDIDLVNRFDPSYPSLLFEIQDPPPLLYYRGRMPDSAKKSITLTGTSSATAEGIELTSRLAREFTAAGVQVVSSLSSGIDQAAHLATRAAEASSFAIVETGFDKINTETGMPLAIDIVAKGGVISEQAPDGEYTEDSWSQANRLMAGLTQAVIVTEVYESSSRTLDLLNYCHEIGTMTFLMIDPEQGALADEKSLSHAIEEGTLPIEGFDKIQDIVRTLV